MAEDFELILVALAAVGIGVVSILGFLAVVSYFLKRDMKKIMENIKNKLIEFFKLVYRILRAKNEEDYWEGFER